MSSEHDQHEEQQRLLMQHNQEEERRRKEIDSLIQRDLDEAIERHKDAITGGPLRRLKHKMVDTLERVIKKDGKNKTFEYLYREDAEEALAEENVFEFLEDAKISEKDLVDHHEDYLHEPWFSYELLTRVLKKHPKYLLKNFDEYYALAQIHEQEFPFHGLLELASEKHGAHIAKNYFKIFTIHGLPTKEFEDIIKRAVTTHPYVFSGLLKRRGFNMHRDLYPFVSSSFVTYLAKELPAIIMANHEKFSKGYPEMQEEIWEIICHDHTDRVISFFKLDNNAPKSLKKGLHPTTRPVWARPQVIHQLTATYLQQDILPFAKRLKTLLRTARDYPWNLTYKQLTSMMPGSFCEELYASDANTAALKKQLPTLMASMNLFPMVSEELHSLLFFHIHHPSAPSVDRVRALSIQKDVIRLLPREAQSRFLTMLLKGLAVNPELTVQPGALWDDLEDFFDFWVELEVPEKKITEAYSESFKKFLEFYAPHKNENTTKKQSPLLSKQSVQDYFSSSFGMSDKGERKRSYLQLFLQPRPQTGYEAPPINRGRIQLLADIQEQDFTTVDSNATFETKKGYIDLYYYSSSLVSFEQLHTLLKRREFPLTALEQCSGVFLYVPHRFHGYEDLGLILQDTSLGEDIKRALLRGLLPLITEIMRHIHLIKNAHVYRHLLLIQHDLLELAGDHALQYAELLQLIKEGIEKDTPGDYASLLARHRISEHPLLTETSKKHAHMSEIAALYSQHEDMDVSGVSLEDRLSFMKDLDVEDLVSFMNHCTQQERTPEMWDYLFQRLDESHTLRSLRPFKRPEHLYRVFKRHSYILEFTDTKVRLLDRLLQLHPPKQYLDRYMEDIETLLKSAMVYYACNENTATRLLIPTFDNRWRDTFASLSPEFSYASLLSYLHTTVRRYLAPPSKKRTKKKEDYTSLFEKTQVLEWAGTLARRHYPQSVEQVDFLTEEELDTVESYLKDRFKEESHSLYSAGLYPQEFQRFSPLSVQEYYSNISRFIPRFASELATKVEEESTTSEERLKPFKEYLITTVSLMLKDHKAHVVNHMDELLDVIKELATNKGVQGIELETSDMISWLFEVDDTELSIGLLEALAQRDPLATLDLIATLPKARQALLSYQDVEQLLSRLLLKEIQEPDASQRGIRLSALHMYQQQELLSTLSLETIERLFIENAQHWDLEHTRNSYDYHAWLHEAMSSNIYASELAMWESFKGKEQYKTLLLFHQGYDLASPDGQEMFLRQLNDDPSKLKELTGLSGEQLFLDPRLASRYQLFLKVSDSRTQHQTKLVHLLRLRESYCLKDADALFHMSALLHGGLDALVKDNDRWLMEDLAPLYLSVYLQILHDAAELKLDHDQRHTLVQSFYSFMKRLSRVPHVQMITNTHDSEYLRALLAYVHGDKLWSLLNLKLGNDDHPDLPALIFNHIPQDLYDSCLTFEDEDNYIESHIAFEALRTRHRYSHANSPEHLDWASVQKSLVSQLKTWVTRELDDDRYSHLVYNDEISSILGPITASHMELFENTDYGESTRSAADIPVRRQLLKCLLQSRPLEMLGYLYTYSDTDDDSQVQRKIDILSSLGFTPSDHTKVLKFLDMLHDLWERNDNPLSVSASEMKAIVGDLFMYCFDDELHYVDISVSDFYYDLQSKLHNLRYDVYSMPDSHDVHVAVKLAERIEHVIRLRKDLDYTPLEW